MFMFETEKISNVFLFFFKMNVIIYEISKVMGNYNEQGFRQTSNLKKQNLDKI